MTIARRTSWAAAALLAVVAAGCATKAQVRDAAADAGVLQSHAAPFEKVRQAALSVLADASLSVSDERWMARSRWSVLATSGLGLPPRRVARIIVEDHPSECRVWILVQSRPAVPEDDVAQDYQGRIAKALGLETRPERSSLDVAGALEARYRSPIARCVDRASRTLLDGGYRVLEENSQDPALRSISAERKPTRLFAAFYRQSEDVTRIVLEVRGGSTAENRDEASELHQKLLQALESAP